MGNKRGSDESTGKVTVKPDENKKKEVEKPKEEPKEEEPPFAMKLKKAERVQRTWEDPKMETVKLAHHEFEKAPQDIEPEGKSAVKLGQSLECDLNIKDDKEGKDKKKKKKKSKSSDESPEEMDDDEQPAKYRKQL